MECRVNAHFGVIADPFTSSNPMGLPSWMYADSRWQKIRDPYLRIMPKKATRYASTFCDAGSCSRYCIS